MADVEGSVRGVRWAGLGVAVAAVGYGAAVWRLLGSSDANLWMVLCGGLLVVASGLAWARGRGAAFIALLGLLAALGAQALLALASWGDAVRFVPALLAALGLLASLYFTVHWAQAAPPLAKYEVRRVGAGLGVAGAAVAFDAVQAWQAALPELAAAFATVAVGYLAAGWLLLFSRDHHPVPGEGGQGA